MAKGDGKSVSDEAKKAAEKKAAEEAAAKAAAEKAAKEKADETDEEEPEGKSKPKEKTFSKSDVDAQVKKAVDAALKKADDEKDLTELEKIKKENEELREANRLRDAKDSVVEALTKAGGRSNELLWKAIKDDLEFDDKGNVKNLDTLLTSLKTDYADQFGEPKPGETIDGGAGGEAANAGKLTAAQLEKMTPQEVSKLPWDDVKAAMTAKP